MVQQQSFFDPPAEFISSSIQELVDAANQAVNELEAVVASRRSAIGFDLDPLNVLFPKRPARELLAEGRRIADALPSPLAEALNADLDALADAFKPRPTPRARPGAFSLRRRV